MLNKGNTGSRSPRLELPPALESAWHTRGYYGSVSHNVKAIYQRYLGWYDGNPAHLWPHPPPRPRSGTSRRSAGSIRSSKAPEQPSIRRLPLGRELLNHAVFADPDHTAARAPLPTPTSSSGTARERDLAELLPFGRHRTPRRQLRHPGRDGSASDSRPAHCRTDLRLTCDLGQRTQGMGSRPDTQRDVYRSQYELSGDPAQRRAHDTPRPADTRRPR